ncbi:hypothetical protein BJV78DRAFT_1298383 [Lactifluus subvellereus]|nr:hypothetical protein BJV78DRAFT_1298383 [Lactifluus subvellereus]
MSAGRRVGLLTVDRHVVPYDQLPCPKLGRDCKHTPGQRGGAAAGAVGVNCATGTTAHTNAHIPQPERESTRLIEDVSVEPPVYVLIRLLIGPGAALPYMPNDLHVQVKTDQTSTGASTPGPQSAYGSEYGDGEVEEQEQEQEDAPPDDLIDIYGDPAKLLQYRRAVAIRMEEEGD